MIITGGVNVYPKEVEDLLAMHPDVEDVAVFGIPNPDFGEEVKAVVQPRVWPADDAAFAEALIAHCRANLSPITVPRPRSEEHTSELQSLMSTAYAVFCWNKKRQQEHTTA